MREYVYTHRVPVKFLPSAELHIILGFLFLLNDSRSPESSVTHGVKENILCPDPSCAKGERWRGLNSKQQQS